MRLFAIWLIATYNGREWRGVDRRCEVSTPRPTLIHQGWLPADRSRTKEPKFTITQKGKERYLETEPLEMECSPEGVTPMEWQEIEAWVQRAAPLKGRFLQLLFTCSPQCRAGNKPLELRLRHEQSKISRDQRDRVSGSIRSHRHRDESARLQVVLRQTVRSA